ncbi:hypothetical protein PMIT1306_00738 [Prochlorococcus sp. MIT 1306]|nr:hypothetical protein PMIT1306_00738 [Prochlorococcus sp. MIT 1306]
MHAPDLATGNIIHFNELGANFISEIQSCCEYELSDAANSSFYLSTATRYLNIPHAEQNKGGTFFGSMLNEKGPKELILISDDSGSCGHLTCPDEIGAGATRGDFNNLGLVELRDNVLIPEIQIPNGPFSQSIVNCQSRECLWIDPIRLLSKDKMLINFSNFYAVIEIKSGPGTARIFGKVRSCILPKESDEKRSKFVQINLGYTLIPLSQYPYYGYISASINLESNENIIEAIVPSYHSDCDINSQRILKMFKTSFSYNGQVHLFCFNTHY